jgi:hypothetical protein
MIRSRRGQLVIFDALLFLSVSAVASVGLVAAFQASPMSDRADVHEFAEGVHAVLLGTTLRKEEGQVGEEIASLAAGVLAKGGQADPEYAWLCHEVDGILNNLCSPRFGHQWVAQDGNERIVVGSDPGGPDSPDVYVSSIDVATGTEATFVLSIWLA